MFGSREVFTYYECSVCGCLWIAKVPDDLSRHYGAGYYALSEPALQMFVRSRPALYRIAHYVRNGTRPHLPEWWPSKQTPNGARILDIGSGVGRLLMHLKSLGYQNLLGIDPFVEKDARIPNGPTILKKSIEETTGQFDLVVMNHSLEHMAHPRIVFDNLRRILAPSGVVVIRTPVASSQAWREYGADWVQLDAPRHLVVHSAKSIEVLAAGSGLTLDRVVYDSSAFQFWGSEQYRRGIPLMDRRSYQLSARKSIFSPQDIDDFSRRASEVNRGGEGDQASFYLRHTASSS